MAHLLIREILHKHMIKYSTRLIQLSCPIRGMMRGVRRVNNVKEFLFIF